MLTSLSGSPKRNSLSKRPGLLSAGSMESSLFVAPITTTSPLLSNPSISAKRVDTIELPIENKKENCCLPGEEKKKRKNKEQVVLWMCVFRKEVTCGSDPDDWTWLEPNRLSHQRKWWMDASDKPKKNVATNRFKNIHLMYNDFNFTFKLMCHRRLK